jgi:hypothetical protein
LTKLHKRPEINRFIKEHEARYGWYDEAIQALINAFPSNSDYNSILNKVVVINRLYSTNIYDVDGTAQKILHLQFDSRVHRGDLTLVHDIASPDLRYSKNTNYTYSFATKYCNWHAKEFYPIFDSVVKRVVSKYNREHNFSDIRVKDYWDYVSWKQVIDDITKVLSIEDYRYKKADKYLWALGVNGEQ